MLHAARLLLSRRWPNSKFTALTSRAEQAFALASLNFATQSVLHKTIAADLQEYRAYLRPTVFDDLGNGLSLMATDPNSGELMGILVVRDFRKQRIADDLPYLSLIHI